MEKRLFLAIILSFFILFTWNKIFPQPKPVIEERGETQTIENKEIINDVAQKNLDNSIPNVEPIQTAADIKENISTIDNEQLSVDFSNIGAVIKSVTLSQYDTKLPIVNINSTQAFENKEFTEKYKSENKIIFQYQTENLTVTKSYNIDENIVTADLQITDNTQMANMDNLVIQAFNLDTSKIDQKLLNSRDKMLQEYSIAKEGEIFRKKDAFKIKDKDFRSEQGVVDWIGFRNRYFCALFKPDYDTAKYEISPKGEKEINIKFWPKNDQNTPENTVFYRNIMFFGPQDINLLKSYELGFENIINYKIGGFFDIMAFGLTDVIAKIILKYLNLLTNIIQNLGISIIILAVSISAVTYPFTRKSMMSMKKMQSIQPKLNKIREQYKNNPQKLNKEMMELYKEHKVNPFGGCLPMFLQMPIFIGLYQVLWRSVSLKGASFLWIKDLSEPDRLFILSNELPVIGNEINILPILMMIIMVFQQKVSAKNMVVADPQQAQQQKMMMFMMPALIGFIFYKFASGLALYFTTFYILSTLTHLRMSKKKAV